EQWSPRSRRQGVPTARWAAHSRCLRDGETVCPGRLTYIKVAVSVRALGNRTIYRHGVGAGPPTGYCRYSALADPADRICSPVNDSAIAPVVSCRSWSAFWLAAAVQVARADYSFADRAPTTAHRISPHQGYLEMIQSIFVSDECHGHYSMPT